MEVNLLLMAFKLIPVAIKAGPLLYAVAGVPVSCSSAPRTLQRPHCAVAQVFAYLVDVMAGCFVMLVAVVHKMFFGFTLGLLWAFAAV